MRPEASNVSAAWELWYRDIFDLDCPPSIEEKGVGLATGLAKLWARHLFETVQPQGAEGFSRFYLKWHGGRVEIAGSAAGAKRLRRWLFGNKRETTRGYAQEAAAQLLATLAAAHARAIARSSASDEILAVAETSADAAEFARRLSV
jgi:hypothetical protein